MMVVASAGTVSAEVPGSGGATPFRSNRPGQIVVPVRLNGQGPFAFILDTGSSHSSISEPLAQTLRAPAVAKALVRSPVGLAMRPIVRLDRVDVGPESNDGVLASVVPSAMLDPNRQIDGVVGQDVLASRRYTIDLAKQKVVWHTAGASLPNSPLSLSLRVAGGRFLVELPQRDSMLLLVPDSGAEGLVLYRRDDLTLPPFMLAPGQVRLGTTTSEANVQPVRVGELRVGPTNLVNLPAVVIDRFGSPANEGDGLLPLHLFTQVTFDGPERRLVVK